MTAKNKVDAKSITSDQLEEMFDDGDDILDYVDLDNPVVEHHPPLEKRQLVLAGYYSEYVVSCCREEGDSERIDGVFSELLPDGLAEFESQLAYQSRIMREDRIMRF